MFYAWLTEFFEDTGYRDTHVLVLDRVDQLPGNPYDLYSCFARLPEIAPRLGNIVTILVVNSLEPRALVATSVPHIKFTRYSASQVLDIAENRPLVALDVLPVADEASADKDRRLFWSRYCHIVHTALAGYVGTDLALLKSTLVRVWPHFIRPVLEGRRKLTDFRALYLDSEALFTSEFAVKDRLIDGTVDEESLGPAQPRTVLSSLPGGIKSGSTETGPSSRHELPVQSKYLLIAAYLASYNPPRFDIRFFSKAKESRAKRRDTGRRKKLKIDPRSLAAPPFELERWLAIYRAISSQNADDESLSTVDVFVQISTLQTLRLVLRTDADPLNTWTKWKVAATWDQVVQLARDLDFPIEDYIV